MPLSVSAVPSASTVNRSAAGALAVSSVSLKVTMTSLPSGEVWTLTNDGG